MLLFTVPQVEGQEVEWTMGFALTEVAGGEEGGAERGEL
jgi:hypothetical protein